MRILLFTGKGGVGKTSLAAATGLQLARLGRRTLVMSVDPAHSLADSFDLETALFHGKTSEPYRIDDHLEILEVNIQKEIKRHWREISSYVVSVLRTTGIGEVEAEELAILPGMEELSAMMYVNQFRREERYDAIVLDCAPTAESMRFVSMPTTLEWYMKHIFPFQRGILKAVRPLANRVSPVELPRTTTLRTSRTCLRSSTGGRAVGGSADHQRAPGHQPGADGVAGNAAGVCVLLAARPGGGRGDCEPCAAGGGDGRLVSGVARLAGRILEEIETYFAPVPVKRTPLFTHEVLGRERLEELARALYGEGEDPAAITRTEAPYTFSKSDGHYEVRVRLPFAAKGEVSLFKKGDELVVEIGTLRRHIGLPTSMAALAPSRARLENRILTVEMKEV